MKVISFQLIFSVVCFFAYLWAMLGFAQPSEAELESLGALAGKCLLEGVALPVELSAATLCFMLDERQLTAEQLMGMHLAAPLYLPPSAPAEETNVHSCTHAHN